jgi:hypothetical protein
MAERYEMHATQMGSEMRRHPHGEWCDADEVLAIELENVKHKATLRQIQGLIEDGSLDDEDVLQKISELCQSI